MERKTRAISWSLFKAGSGKWKYGGSSETAALLHEKEFLTDLIETQRDVTPTAFGSGQYILVTTNHPNNPPDAAFCEALFHPGDLVEAFNRYAKTI